MGVRYQRVRPTTGSSAGSPPLSSAQALSGSSSSRRTSGSTIGSLTNWATTRPDHRRARRDAGVQDPQAAHSQEDRRPACLHHAERRRVLLSPGHQGAWLSRIIERPRQSLSREAQKRGKSYVSASLCPDVQPGSHCAQIHGRQAAHKHLLDVELPLGGATRSGGDGEPLLHHDRGAERSLAGLRDAGVERRAVSAGDRRNA